MSAAGRHLPFLLVILAVALAPHGLHLPLWISVWCLALWGYCWRRNRKGMPPPLPAVSRCLGLAGVGACLIQFGLGFDLYAGIGLLAVLLGVKPLEIQSHRDIMVTLFLALFLVAANLLVSEDLALAFYLVLVVMMFGAFLVRLHRPASGSWRTDLRIAAGIMLWAIPLTLVLFLFFPRISGGLWGFDRFKYGTSGFSERLEPGSIAELVRSNAVAFQVEFQGSPPPYSQLYWRGLVFWQFDGRSWVPGPHPPMIFQQPEGDLPTQYTVTLNPHGNRWLFTLDRPAHSLSWAWLRADGTLKSARRVRSRVRYRMTSYRKPHAQPLQPWEMAAGKLTARGNPLARRLAEQWRQASDSPEAIVDRALAYFGGQGFSYTLSPPPLGDDMVDNFLFETRSGYCEHFASAFAFLMRCAGLPARVVGGYMGGERNPFGRHITVRQSDAHTWVEVWLPSAGWKRIDPTAAVAPGRIQQGPAADLPVSDQNRLYPLRRLGPIYDIWRAASQGWEAMNIQWQRLVVGYTPRRQQTLLSRLGLPKGGVWQKAAVVAVALGLVLAAMIAAQRLLRSRRGKRVDAVVWAYDRFRRKMARAGLESSPSEGPLDFADRSIARRPDLADPIRHITDLYIQTRYGPTPTDTHLQELQQRVGRFRPSGSAPGSRTEGA